MFASLPPLHEERTEPVRHDPPIREPEQIAAPVKKDDPKDQPKPQDDRSVPLTAMGGYSSMMLMANQAYSDMVVSTKGKSKADLPCGDCIGSIAEQLMG